MSAGVEQDFLDWFQQEVILEPRTGMNAHAEPTYGPAFREMARVVQRNRMVRDSKGEERVSTVQVYLNGTILADRFTTAQNLVNARLTLPDGTQPPIISATVMPDEKGETYYVEVFT